MGRIRVVQAIAGLEASSSAGIETDLRVFYKSGVLGVGTLTCIVSIMQNGEHKTDVIDTNTIINQFWSANSVHNIETCKIGMLPNTQTIKTISKLLNEKKFKTVVLDPVLICKDQSEDSVKDTSDELIKYILPYTTVITPNLFEAKKLSKIKNDIATIDDAILAGKKILDYGVKAVVVKGIKHNNAKGLELMSDILVMQENSYTFSEKYNSVGKINGAGCTFSSKIATELDKNEVYQEAIRNAKIFVSKSIENSLNTNTNLNTAYN
jgi:pyridoxine kinase